MLGRAGRVFVFVIEVALLDTDLGHRQRTGRPGFRPLFRGPRFFPPSTPACRSGRPRPGRFPIGRCLSTICKPTLEPCRDGLEHDGRLPTAGQRGFGRVNHREARRGNAGLDAAFFGQHFVEGHAAGFRAATGVGHAAVSPIPPAPSRLRRKSRAGPERQHRCPAAVSRTARCGSSSWTAWPRERKALATAAPERSDTSRSADGPPSMTVTLSFSVNVSLADDLHFLAQFDAPSVLARV